MIAVDDGRLGNQMFIYASLMGIAATNNMTPVYFGSSKCILGNTFNNLSAFVLNTVCRYNGTGIVTLTQMASFFYDNRFERIHELPSRDVQIATFLQSWKYFSSVETKIREEFNFADTPRKEAATFLLQSSARQW